MLLVMSLLDALAQRDTKYQDSLYLTPLDRALVRTRVPVNLHGPSQLAVSPKPTS